VWGFHLVPYTYGARREEHDRTVFEICVTPSDGYGSLSPLHALLPHATTVVRIYACLRHHCSSPLPSSSPQSSSHLVPPLLYIGIPSFLLPHRHNMCHHHCSRRGGDCSSLEGDWSRSRPPLF
jgi:hypothetical protein